MNKKLLNYINDYKSEIFEIIPINNKVFYTAIFKNKNNVDIPNKFTKDPKWDYILFTNIEKLETSWKIIRVKLFEEDPIMTNRIFKWLSHIFLKNYNLVFYMDGYFSPKLEINLNTESILHKNHTKRNCIYKELNACVKSRKINKDMKNNILIFLKNNNGKENNGLFHNDIFLKNNFNHNINKYLEELIHIMIEYNFYRDQPLLPFIYDKYKFKPIINNNLNNLIIRTGNKINHTYT